MNTPKFLNLTVFLFILSFFLGCTLKDHVQPVSIPIGGLASLTGNWSSLGLTTKAAMEIAEEDINAYFSGKHSPYRVSVQAFDTRLEADKAVDSFTSAAGTGTRFFIGPQSSAELATILPLTAGRTALVISQGSTAGSLAIADDPVFRFCPADKIEGAAIAKTIYGLGIRGLVTLARNDAGNVGLQNATGNSFASAGGETQALTPYGTAVSDFSTQLADLKARILALTTTHGAGKVGVYLASFDECVSLFTQAASDPVLRSVRWFGGDGVALSAALLADADAADFAIATQFMAPTFGLPDAYKTSWEPLMVRIKAKTGIDADAFGIAVYDAMWVIAKTIEAGHGVPADLTTLASLFTTQANAYTGATGSTQLDSFGDRASGSFDYFGLEKVGSVYQWKLAGKSE
ncbi:ABC transporter substrate-binding protein [Larkinella bovis]|uniref:ABC transporter substrate-binding protein n=1 Tax=Larkinella bovis TaxID=683041 RepID=A0ABW0I7R0_9BACT